MNYEEIIAEVENGIDWSEWEDTPLQQVLEDRLIAIRQLQAIREQEVLVLHRKQEQLAQLLTVL